MPIYYRGAGPGSYWDINNAQIRGFTAQSPGILPSQHRLVLHVARGTVAGPYISLTRSFGIAWDYATHFGRTVSIATASTPGWVYEVELNDPLPPGLDLIDPVQEIAKNAPGPLSPISYQHDGSLDFLLGVIQPAKLKKYRTASYRQPPPATGTPRPPNLSGELETLVRSLRDAEILAVGNLPAACVRNRFPAF